jgi:hypothetical protein
MPTSTPINGLQVPLLADQANIESATHPLANAIDSLVIARFSTLTARNTAIPSPTFGQMCSVSATGELYMYNGSAWVGARPRFKYKAVEEQVVNSATLQDDNDLWFTAEANSIYAATWVLSVFSASSTPDIRIQYAIPAGCIRRGHFFAYNNVDAFVFNAISEGQADYGLGTVAGSIYPQRHEQIFQTSSTAGDVKLQWAQITSNANATILDEGCYMSVWKIG